ncbi:MAG: biotin/lipoyl-containing protein [Chloroflexota bacterium]|nr:biotin/lipoyl-containing protein [Chloroflexota bacterium]
MALEMVTVPMPGKIIKVSVKPGAKVEEGSELCILESMKMENPILAPVSGTIKEVKVAAGQMVKAETVLAVIEY